MPLSAAGTLRLAFAALATGGSAAAGGFSCSLKSIPFGDKKCKFRKTYITPRVSEKFIDGVTLFRVYT